MAGWVHQDIARRLEKFSQEVAAGTSPRLMLLMPPRHGKALAVGTLVPTTVGFVPVEHLAPGDRVFGRDGRPAKVVAVSEVWRDRELYEVVSDDGASVVVDAEHEWTVRLCRKRPVYKPKTTRELAARTSPRAPALMTYGAVEYPAAELPIDPYVLGVWLGDGCSGHATITRGSQDYDLVRAEIERCGTRTSDRGTDGTFGLLDVFVELKTLGLLRNKHIPEIYRHASVAQRRSLLQGLIDTDGHVAPDGQVEFCSVNEELARHTLMLVRSLGVKASLIQGDATLNGEFISRKYRVMFYMAGAARLPRKAARCRDNARTPHRFLTFKPAGRGDTVCIQLDAPDQQYLVGHGYLLTHNSELVSRMFPAWHLGHYPDHEIIACSYNVSLAMSFSRRVKDVMEDLSYQSVFETRLNPEFKGNEEWGLANGRGQYVAAGIGGGIAGKGAHVLLIDDPIKNAEEADSADNREKQWDWYGSVAYTRLAPGGGVLCVQTWWHDDDIAGRIIKAMAEDPSADQFEIVKYPAIAEDDEFIELDTDRIVQASEIEPDRPRSNYRLLREKGEALHPDRYDLVKLTRIKKTIPPRFWSALYQQNPVPDDGAFFTKDQFRRASTPAVRNCNVFIAWDFAISEKKVNDYTVGTVLLQDYDDTLHVAEVVRFRSADAFFIVESILDLTKRWYSPGLKLGFEDGQIYRAIESLLRKRMHERRMYPAVEQLKPITDKMARARPLQGRMQQRRVAFALDAEWFDTVRNEMLRFPAGVHDDCVDALAWATQLAIGAMPPRPPKEKSLPSWKDKLKLNGRSALNTHMAA